MQSARPYIWFGFHRRCLVAVAELGLNFTCKLGFRQSAMQLLAHFLSDGWETNDRRDYWGNLPEERRCLHVTKKLDKSKSKRNVRSRK